MSNFFSMFDGPPNSSSNHSRNTSRRRQGCSSDRSDAVNFGSFKNYSSKEFRESPESVRGRNTGYKTQEHRPRDFSSSPTPQRRGRERIGYATREVSPRDRSGSNEAVPWNTRGRSQSTSSSRSSSPPRRQRQSPNSFDRFKGSGTSSAYRSPSPPAYRTRRRSPSPPKNAHRYPSPGYRTRRQSPSPPRSSGQYRQSSRRSPSPAQHQTKHREASPTRPCTANTKKANKATRSYRHQSPSPRIYATRSVSPPLAHQRRSSNYYRDKPNPKNKRRPAEKVTPQKKERSEKSAWNFFGHKKSNKEKESPPESTSSSHTGSRCKESRHRAATGDRHLKPQTGSHKTDAEREYPHTRTCHQSERHRSPSPRPRHTSPRQEPRYHSSTERGSPGSGYRTEGHRPEDWYRGHNYAGANSSYTQDQQFYQNTGHEAPRYTPPPTTGPMKTSPTLADLKKLFDAYNARWEALSRIDKKLPLPASWVELKKVSFLGGSSENPDNSSAEAIVIINVQVLFLAGFGLSGIVERDADGLVVIEIDGKERHVDKIKDLKRWLSRKEQPRWHPDRINLRTDKEGVIDEGMSKRTAVVAMRGAAQALLECIAQAT